MAFGPGLVIAIVKMMIAFIASQIVIAITKRDQDLPEDSDIGHLSSDCSTDWIIPLIYGRCRTGTNRVFASTTGADNQFLHLILEIGEGQIYGIARQDGSTFTSTGAVFPSSNPPLLYLDGDLWTSKWGTDYVYAEFFNGSSTQNVCSTLRGYDSSWNDPKRYTAYLYLRLKYNMDKFQGIPDVTLVVDGLQLYDPTAGTVAYNYNFALMLYDMMTRPGHRGGLGLDNWHAAPPADARIDIASVEAARAYCEAKGWTGGLVLNTDYDFADKARLILDCFRGEIIYSETVYKIRFRDLNYEESVADIVESDVVEENGRTTLSIAPSADLYDLPNAVEAEFYSEANNWQKDSWLHTDADAIASEGDTRKVQIKLLGLNTIEKLQPMAFYHLERARWGHVASLSVRDAFIALETSDIVTLTHSMPGWDEILFRILSVGFDPNTWTIQLELLEEDVDLYDDAYNPSLLTWHTTNLPSPEGDYVPSVINASISEVTFNTRLRSYTRLVVDFDPPTDYPWWDYAQVWLSIDGGDYRYMTQSRDGWILEPVEEGVEYAVKLVSVNIWGAPENYDGAVTVSRLVQGVTSTPSNVTGLTAAANGDSVSIYAAILDDDDIEGYEVRLGDAWEGGIFVSFNKAPTLRLNGVRPGVHTFWMAAKNNAGNYSGTPASATVRVFVPPGFTSAHSWSWDFTTGTHDNTEHVTYNSQDALKCSHASDVLTGDWTSPTYDMGSLKTVRVWGDFLTVFIAGSSTWGGVLPSPATWESVGAASKSWAQIFQPTAAGQIEATLQFSENGADWSDVDFFAVLCAEVYARYLRVVVTITDPSLDANLYLYELNMSAHIGPS